MRIKRIILCTAAGCLVLTAVFLVFFLRNTAERRHRFSENGLHYLLYKDYAVLTGCDENVTSVQIPATLQGRPVTEIRKEAFQQETAIETVKIPGSVKIIGENAFSQCTSLRSVRMEDGVTELGFSAFSNCSALTEVELSSDLRILDKSVFYYCTELRQIALPDGMESINASAFSGCSLLKDIYIPATIQKISYGAFENCDKLSHIWYSGTMETWETLKVGYLGNVNFTNADVHFEISSPAKMNAPVAGSVEGTGSGDMDENGRVDAIDAAIILTEAALSGVGEPSSWSAEQQNNADINRDGVSDAVDASLILQYSAEAAMGGGVPPQAS